MSEAYNRAEYYDALEAVLLFIRARGLQYVTDIDEHEECEAAVDCMLNSNRGPTFKIAAKYFSTAVKSKKEICVASLKSSDLDSQKYRDSFSSTFMEVVNHLDFIPKPRKLQIKRVVEGKKDIKDEKECIVLLQNLLYAVLPKFFKVDSTALRQMVAKAGTPEPVSGDSGSE